MNYKFRTLIKKSFHDWREWGEGVSKGKSEIEEKDEKRRGEYEKSLDPFKIIHVIHKIKFSLRKCTRSGSFGGTINYLTIIENY